MRACPLGPERSGSSNFIYFAKLPVAKFLGYCSSRLNSVDLNYTFRRFPTAKLLTGWVAATPADFKFAVKANPAITHEN